MTRELVITYTATAVRTVTVADDFTLNSEAHVWAALDWAEDLRPEMEIGDFEATRLEIPTPLGPEVRDLTV